MPWLSKEERRVQRSKWQTESKEEKAKRKQAIKIKMRDKEKKKTYPLARFSTSPYTTGVPMAIGGGVGGAALSAPLLQRISKMKLKNIKNRRLRGALGLGTALGAIGGGAAAGGAGGAWAMKQERKDMMDPTRVRLAPGFKPRTSEKNKALRAAVISVPTSTLTGALTLGALTGVAANRKLKLMGQYAGHKPKVIRKAVRKYVLEGGRKGALFGLATSPLSAGMAYATDLEQRNNPKPEKFIKDMMHETDTTYRRARRGRKRRGGKGLYKFER